ncbi:unnamed protein product [Schistosoma curassoni]|uniref:Uncharacterized protein n=1 Tax=Schistosoma curassoni TaxID=6186 RepID=A0A183L3G1_9TREM|nr:unnamed protein product [Schistosoma curassoni]
MLSVNQLPLKLNWLKKMNELLIYKILAMQLHKS